MKSKRILATLVICVIVACLFSDVAIPAANNNKVRVLIGFRHTPGPSEQALVRRAGGDINFSYHIIPTIAASVPVQALRGLRNNPNISYIEEDTIAYAVDDLLPWGVDRIDADEVWTPADGSSTGAGVNVAILDTGIDYTHEDLKVEGGIDFINLDDDPLDDNGHGTHVAGTVAARDNDIGVIGVAPGAKLYAVKVLNARGSGYWSQIIAGIEWCTDTRSNSLPDIQVINMSIGGGYSTSMEIACQEAYDAGIVIVAAAGNENSSVSYPAAYTSVIAVAATDSSDNKASFSNFGPEVELAAPGVGIYSTFPTYRVNLSRYDSDGDGYTYLQGTSMASPHVAGVAALVIAANPSLTNAQVRSILDSTASDLGAAGWDQYFGFGLVDAYAAVAGSYTPPQPPSQTAGNVIVDSIKYSTSGGKIKDLLVSVSLIDDLGNSVSNATVLINLYCNGELYATGNGITGTNGTITFLAENPPSGTYTTEVTDVDAVGLTWDGSYPTNSYLKRK